MKKNFVILKDVSSLRQSYQLSDLSYNDYFVMRIDIYICMYVCMYVYDFK